MLAYLILLLAILSRLVPHALHGVGLNVTLVGGGLLFFGAHRPRREALFAALALAATDVYLTTVVFHYPFHLSVYLVTWLWYAAVPLLGLALLAPKSDNPRQSATTPAHAPGATDRRPTLLRAAAAVLASSTSFYLLSNFVVWVESTMYPHNSAGLLACYTAAIPFYGNDLVSTALTTAALFGLPALAHELHRTLHRPSHTPLS